MPIISCAELNEELSLPIGVVSVGVDCNQLAVTRNPLQHSCIVFVKSGSGVIEIGGKNTNIKKGQAIFAAKGVDCSLTPGKDGVTIDWFSFEITSTALWYSLFTKNMFTLFEVKHANIIENGIVNIYDCIEPSQSYSGYLASAAAYKLLVEINADSKTKKKINKKTTELVKNVIKYIEKNLTKEITLGDLCEEAGGISEQYLCRLFKRHTGERPIEFVLHKRIVLAKAYLENTDIPIPEVATSTGFNNTSYFYRNFKKFSGMSPLAYRKMSLISNDNDLAIRD